MDKKTCFVIAPIGEDASEIRKRSDQVLKYVISPAVEPLGYKVIRADSIEKPGLITSQVIQMVLDSELVIADLTGWNANVFYELAIRHSIRKPYLQIIQHGERIPFDVAGVRTLVLNYQDLESVDKCKAQIKGGVESMEKNEGEIDSPVTTAVEIQSLRRSDQPVEQYLAGLTESFSQLTSKVDSALQQLSGIARQVSNSRVVRHGTFGGTHIPNVSGNVIFANPNLGWLEDGVTWFNDVEPIRLANPVSQAAVTAAQGPPPQPPTADTSPKEEPKADIKDPPKKG